MEESTETNGKPDPSGIDSKGVDMKTFKRFKDIVNANVHAKLDKMEDPEKMIRFMLTEMEETLVEAKSAAAERLANRAMIADEIKRTKDLLSRWEHRAHLAVEKDRDDLAREALVEKNRVVRRLATLEEELLQMQSIIDSMQDQIVKLEAKREEVRDKQRMLVQRAYHAKEKKKVVETLREIDTVASCRRFAELEEKIERMEADAEMAGFSSESQTKEKQFSQMETDEVIEAELAKMKASKSKKKEG